MTTEEFRRHLAGLSDKRDSGAFSEERMQATAVDLYVALAVLFNRRKLDAKTLWTRLDTAIQKGCSAANGCNVSALVNAACEHVLAAANGIVQPEVHSLIQPVLSLDEDAAYAFVRYLESSRFTVLAFATQAWAERKSLLKVAKDVEQQQAEMEGVE